MHLSHEQLTFLAGFARSTQGMLIRQVFEGRLAEVDRALRVLKGEDLLQAQGKAQELVALIKILDDAPASLDRSLSARSQGTRQGAKN